MKKECNYDEIWHLLKESFSNNELRCYKEQQMIMQKKLLYAGTDGKK